MTVPLTLQNPPQNSCIIESLNQDLSTGLTDNSRSHRSTQQQVCSRLQGRNALLGGDAVTYALTVHNLYTSSLIYYKSTVEVYKGRMMQTLGLRTVVLEGGGGLPPG